MVSSHCSTNRTYRAAHGKYPAINHEQGMGEILIWIYLLVKTPVQNEFCRDYLDLTIQFVIINCGHLNLKINYKTRGVNIDVHDDEYKPTAMVLDIAGHRIFQICRY
jgi:hypothetical protein